MIKDFKDKVAVVTGAGSGIGRSLAHAFAKRGMKIVIADVNEPALNSVSDELTEGGTEVLSMVVDVSDCEQVAKMADATYDRFGSANILCNNAGVGGGAPFQFATLADWDWVLGVNQFGVIYGIKSFLPRMVESGEQCHIVNTASMAGHLAGDGGQYAVSKFAVVSMSESLRTECFNTKVGVSVLCPGYVDTQIMKNAESLRTGRSDLFQPTAEMAEMRKSMMENVANFLSSGMSPDTIAEKVIIAIEEDILHVLTHPEYIPAIEARFNSIRNDTLKLDRIYTDSIGEGKETAKTSPGLKTFTHDSPDFSIQYPENFVPLQALLIPHVVLYTVQIPGADFIIRVIDKSDPTLPSDYSLENSTHHLSRMLENFGTDIMVISDQQTTLKDGTPASLGEIEYRRVGLNKAKVLGFTVARENKWINITIGAIFEIYREEMKEIFYSLEFM